jgi:hypothetical protein
MFNTDKKIFPTNKILSYREFKQIVDTDPTVIERSLSEFKDLIIFGLKNRFINGLREDIHHILYENQSLLGWNIPIFLQEYYYLFYLSLKLLKNVPSNSHIIGIGESPMKIIFTQSLFYDDNDTYCSIKNNNNFPTNLDFSYFPLSEISSYTQNQHQNLNYTYDSITDNLKNNFNDEKKKQFYEYFLKFNLNPKKIIADNKNFIFYDRVERFKTIFSFIYIYSCAFKEQLLTLDEKEIFLSKFRFIGFDGDYDNTQITCDRVLLVRECIAKWFEIPIEKAILMFNFNLIKIPLISDNLKNNMKIDYMIKPYLIPHNIINYLSIPEKNKIDNRCIISAKINNFDNINSNNIHEKNKSINCNVSNFIIYLSFIEIKNRTNQNIYELIENINYIKEDTINILKTEYLDPAIFIKLNKILIYYYYFKQNMPNINRTYSRKYMKDINFLQSSIYNEAKLCLKNILCDTNIIKNTIFSIKLKEDKNNFKYKYLKYKKKYLELQEKKYIGGGGKRILYLDFDETLGSFNVNYSVFARILNNYRIDNNLALLIKKELLENYYIRTHLKVFFDELNELKKTNKINKIIILSRNSDRNNYPGYFQETINLIQEISQTPDLIDKIITGVREKNISTNNSEDIIKIVDDKCEHINKQTDCLSVTPYVVYVDYTILLSIIKQIDEKNLIAENIMVDIERILKILSEGDFSSDIDSYPSQYPQIENFSEKFKPTTDYKVKKYDDDELMRILGEIKEIYK